MDAGHFAPFALLLGDGVDPLLVLAAFQPPLEHVARRRVEPLHRSLGDLPDHGKDRRHGDHRSPSTPAITERTF